ncbi:hypothetical protein K458DRAFT_427033 [Lentithecium fluviatile CBS 122367]|uniref:Uncharacterized protein n=1 Tax=Lentithecium fluviatile CBS 122367 TaxID=1168545 RepID=A0A6G1JI37_9PLEO|nr:hypothetical protein K458DRAFT_427033 [Lentithecium fluviatile CBS 122367]
MQATAEISERSAPPSRPVCAASIPLETSARQLPEGAPVEVGEPKEEATTSKPCSAIYAILVYLYSRGSISESAMVRGRRNLAVCSAARSTADRVHGSHAVKLSNTGRGLLCAPSHVLQQYIASGKTARFPGIEGRSPVPALQDCDNHMAPIFTLPLGEFVDLACGLSHAVEIPSAECYVLLCRCPRTLIRTDLLISDPIDLSPNITAG